MEDSGQRAQAVAKKKRQIRPWSQVELTSLAKMRADGMKVPGIALALGRPAEAVYSMCKRLIRSGQLCSAKGRTWVTDELILLGNATLTDKQLAQLLQRTPQAVKTKRLALALRPKLRQRWSEDLDSQLMKLRKSGLYFSGIARSLDRTESAVSNRVHLLIMRGKLDPLSRSERSRRGASIAALTREDRWTDGERVKVTQLWKLGFCASEIGVMSGRSRSSIENALGFFRKAKLIAPLSQKEMGKHLSRARLERYQMLCADAVALVKALSDTVTAGYIIGVLYGDGFITVTGRSGSIGLKSTNESFCIAFVKALEEVFRRKTRLLSRIEPVKRIGDYVYENVRYHEAFLHSVHIGLAIRERFGYTDEHRWCANPDMILQIGSNFADGLLQGFFDAEGSIMRNKWGRYYMSACSMNEKGLKSIHQIFLRRGYRATISDDARGQWKVSIHTQTDVSRFAAEIGSRIDYKKARFEACLSQSEIFRAVPRPRKQWKILEQEAPIGL